MTLPVALTGLPEILGTLTADTRGQLRHATHPDKAERNAAAAAAAMNEITAAGGAVGFARLEMLLVKGASKATVTAMRSDEILLVMVDPAKGTAQVEKALHAWASNGAAAPAAPPGVSAPAAAPRSAHAEARVSASDDPWAALRRSLVRGLLTEAAARRREIADTTPAAGRAGVERLAAAEIDQAMLTLVQGVGSVLAGDGLGGARTLEALAGDSQKNLSFRWLALWWSARAMLKSGNSAAARTHVKQALALGKQLDREAVALSQWVAAKVLVNDGEHGKALAYLEQARAAFQRLGDRWGLGRTWLAEARALLAQERDPEAVAAARQAWATDRAWEEPVVFLARRALLRGDLAEAEGLLRYVNGQSAERLRSLIEAIRQQGVSQADAIEFLRESDAPPTVRSIRAMERLSQASPRFVQARDALAWMLLKVGKYAEASTIFRGLLAQQLKQADRASVMLGLGCIAHAQQTGKDPDSKLHAAVTAGGAAPGPGAPDAQPLPALSTSTLAARVSQIVGGGPVFSGQLSVFPLPDVVEFVRSARRTGLLVCSSQKGMAAVNFRDGRITGATSPGTPDVGEILLRARKISSVALKAARASQPADQPDHVLGAWLLREGLVDAAAVQEALRWGIEATFRDLVQWRDGEFAFNREGENEPASAPAPIDLDAQDVLLNVFRQMDEDARDAVAPGVPR
ncbi:MAG TPA: DUF4388 domain-containing protein [Anaeromyxobacter sp.]|nr:DUF4388 domain-containing protein [Anaeromyxobacter sp.]